MYAIPIDNRVIVTNLSVGVAVIVFIAVILYHIIDSLTSTSNNSVEESPVENLQHANTY